MKDATLIDKLTPGWVSQMAPPSRWALVPFGAIGGVVIAAMGRVMLLLFAGGDPDDGWTQTILKLMATATIGAGWGGFVLGAAIVAPARKRIVALVAGAIVALVSALLTLTNHLYPVTEILILVAVLVAIGVAWEKKPRTASRVIG